MITQKPITGISKIPDYCNNHDTWKVCPHKFYLELEENHSPAPPQPDTFCMADTFSCRAFCLDKAFGNVLVEINKALPEWVRKLF